jgi:hypothetical protein
LVEIEWVPIRTGLDTNDPDPPADFRCGPDFLGFKDEEVRQTWMGYAQKPRALGVWFREGILLSDAEVLARLRQRYPRGVAQGTLTLEDCRESRKEFTQARVPIHEVSPEKWCRCSSGRHNGLGELSRNLILPNVLSYVKRNIREAGYGVVD